MTLETSDTIPIFVPPTCAEAKSDAFRRTAERAAWRASRVARATKQLAEDRAAVAGIAAQIVAGLDVQGWRDAINANHAREALAYALTALGHSLDHLKEDAMAAEVYVDVRQQMAMTAADRVSVTSSTQHRAGADPLASMAADYEALAAKLDEYARGAS